MDVAGLNFVDGNIDPFLLKIVDVRADGIICNDLSLTSVAYGESNGL